MSDLQDKQDPFDEENFRVVQFILLSRIYDVNMAILAQMNPAKAEELEADHAKGDLWGPWPMLAAPDESTDNS